MILLEDGSTKTTPGEGTYNADGTVTENYSQNLSNVLTTVHQLHTPVTPTEPASTNIQGKQATNAFHRYGCTDGW